MIKLARHDAIQLKTQNSLRAMAVTGLALVIMLCTIPAVMGQGVGGTITLDHTDGLADSGVIASQTPITFYLRAINHADHSWPSVGNAFVLTSPDGADWTGLSGEWASGIDPDTLFTITSVIEVGPAGDTVLFGGAAFPGDPGFPVGLDEVVWVIRLDPIDSVHIGRTICLDSSWQAPGVVGMSWYWNDSEELIHPDWDGPHCFTIGGCCRGTKGNADGDPNDMVNINDLLYLVDYGFKGGPPPACVKEGDANGDGSLTPFLLDIVYLVEYLFKGGPPPPDCG